MALRSDYIISDYPTSPQTLISVELFQLLFDRFGSCTGSVYLVKTALRFSSGYWQVLDSLGKPGCKAKNEIGVKLKVKMA